MRKWTAVVSILLTLTMTLYIHQQPAQAASCDETKAISVSVDPNPVTQYDYATFSAYLYYWDCTAQDWLPKEGGVIHFMIDGQYVGGTGSDSTGYGSQYRWIYQAPGSYVVGACNVDNLNCASVTMTVQ